MGISITRRRRGFLLPIGTAFLMLTTATNAAEPTASTEPVAAAEDTAERCIPIRSIKQTKVIDDQTIIFYTSGKRNYKNRLPYSCGGLAIADSFMYRTSVSQLCSVDIITVLNRMGSNYGPGPSCGLGVFEQIDARQLDELTGRPARKQ